MNNRQTGGIPTKVRMPPVFEIMILAKFLKIAQLQEIAYREVALFGNARPQRAVRHCANAGIVQGLQCLFCLAADQ